MRAPTRERGFTITELLLAVTITLILLLGALAMMRQATTIDKAVQGSARIHSSLRLAMNQLEFDLRQTGLGVPRGTRTGGSESWFPYIFYANDTNIGFAADVDDGVAEVTCTPTTGNATCPATRIRLDRISYYQAINCTPPDGASGVAKIVVSVNGDKWEATTCSAYDVANKYLTVPAVTSATYFGGRARVATIEQVYYRYVASGSPPYGKLQRFVAYLNMPDTTFPPSGSPAWVDIATNLTDFELTYRNAAGAAVTGSPISAANRATIRNVAIYMEGYDLAQPQGIPQLLRIQSEVTIRNPHP